MSRLISLFAAASLPLAVALAHAAPPPSAEGPVYPKHDPKDFLQEPAASVRTGSAEADLGNAIAQALNADADLKYAKITVQPEKDSILLTGVALNNAQRTRAAEIATQNSGGLQVVNAIQSEELTVAPQAGNGDSPQPGTVPQTGQSLNGVSPQEGTVPQTGQSPNGDSPRT